MSVKSMTTTVKCGTCQFWTGSREPGFDSQGKPIVFVHDSNGACENVHSRFCDQDRKESARCVLYSKWTEIL